MGSVAVSNKVWRREGDIITHEVVAHVALPVVTGLIDASRRARTVADDVAVQKELARQAWDARDLHRQLTDHRDELKHEMEAARAAKDQAAIRRIDRLLKDHELTLLANQRRRYALRVVQDGIVWRKVGFDRHVIALLGDAPPIGYPSDSFLSEAGVADEYWSDGLLALFCDLSNCARTGDLLVFDEAKREMRIIEVKESPREVRRHTTQDERTLRKVELFNTGRSDTLADVPLIGPGRRPRLKTHLANLPPLLARARTRGFAEGRVADHLVVSAVDARLENALPDLDEMAERIASRQQVVRRRAGWTGGAVFNYTTHQRREADEHTNLVSTAPFSLFPMSAEDCAALALGIAGYVTHTNLAYIKTALERLGYRVRLPSGPSDIAEAFLHVQRDDRILRLPARVVDQLTIELASVGSIVQLVEAAFERPMDPDVDKLHAGFAWSEADVWL